MHKNVKENNKYKNIKFLKKNIFLIFSCVCINRKYYEYVRN